MRICAAGILSLLFATSAVAQTTTSLSLHVVSHTQPEKGHMIVTMTKLVFEERIITEKVEINGQLVDVTKRIPVQVPVQYDVAYDLTASKVITPEGKQLPIDEVWKRLKKDSVVAISGDFNTPAAVLLRAVHADTLVVIPPPPKKAPADK